MSEMCHYRKSQACKLDRLIDAQSCPNTRRAASENSEALQNLVEIYNGWMRYILSEILIRLIRRIFPFRRALCGRWHESCALLREL
jgi:hypothetical protein